MLISINIPKNSKYLLIFMVLELGRGFIRNTYHRFYYDNHNFLYSLSFLFLFLFYFWEKNLSKKDNKKEKSTINNNYLIKRIILIISYLMFYVIYNYIFKFKIDKLSVIEHYNVVFFLLVFIELIFFKKYIYSHHIISIIITFIILIYYRRMKDFKSTYFFILQYYCNCFCFLLIKYISTKYFINIYLLGSLIGIPGLIQFYRSSFFKDIKENRLICVLLFILFVFHNYIYCLVIFKIGVIVAIIPNSIVSFITEIIKGKLPISEIMLIVLFFISCLIYLEILELKFWGLNKNITKNIIERGTDEMNIDLTMSEDSLISNP